MNFTMIHTTVASKIMPTAMYWIKRFVVISA